ncbi:MAG: DUF6029 family protein [Acidobacteriota bacterium]
MKQPAALFGASCAFVAGTLLTQNISFATELAGIPFSIQGSTTLLYRSFSDSFLERTHAPDHDRWEFYSRTILDLSRGPVIGGIQLDINAFDRSDSDAEVHKWYLEYRGSALTATAGDFFAAFGRGTALSVVKTHESYGMENQVDDTIRGGRLRYLGERIQAEAVGGRVRGSTAAGDDIYGGTVSLRLARWLGTGASAVKARMKDEDRDVDTAGLNVTLQDPDGAVEIYIELAGSSFSRPYPNGATNGQAAYVEAAVHTGDLSITTEYESLKDYFFQYSTPPILEVQSEELLADFFAVDRENLQAARIRADYTRGPDIFSGYYAHYAQRASRRPPYPAYARQIDAYALGYERSFESGFHIEASLGRRQEDGGGYYFQFSGPTTYGRAFLEVPLPWAFSSTVEYRRAQLDGDYVQYQRNKLAVSIAKSQLFSLAGVWESSNLPSELFENGKENFYYAQAEIKLMKRHLLSIFAGETRGGTKCSGGVCKYVPAFGGVRVEAVIRF